MIKIYTCFILLTISLAACDKHQSNPLSPNGNPILPAGQANIVGKWNIISVTTYFYDSAGLRNNSVHVYPGQPFYYFQFNSDKSWVESLVPDTLSDLGMTGTYTLTSDSTFTLLNPKGVPPATPCTILSLADTLFVFSHQRPTAFNGTDSGYIKYVFQLKK
jgi:hypothetical protein